MSIDTPANPPVDAFEAALAVTEVAPVIEEVIAPVIEDVVEESAVEEMMRMLNLELPFATPQVSGLLFIHTLAMKRK